MPKKTFPLYVFTNWKVLKVWVLVHKLLCISLLCQINWPFNDNFCPISSVSPNHLSTFFRGVFKFLELSVVAAVVIIIGSWWAEQSWAEQSATQQKVLRIAHRSQVHDHCTAWLESRRRKRQQQSKAAAKCKSRATNLKAAIIKFRFQRPILAFGRREENVIFCSCTLGCREKIKKCSITFDWSRKFLSMLGCVFLLISSSVAARHSC